MAQFELKEMTPEDLEAAVHIVSDHDETDGRMAQRYFEGFFAEERRHRERENNLVCVDTDSATVVGLGGFTPDEYEWPGVLWLTWLYVAKSHHGQGLGWMLMERILDDARALDTRKLYLDTSSDPIYSRAIDFYRRVGFQEEGRLRDYYDKGEDFLILGLQLRDPK